MIRIDPNAEPIHHPVYKRVSFSGRPRIITREQIEDGKVRAPDPALYEQRDPHIWVLKE